MIISHAKLLGLLRAIAFTKPEEVDCEEFLSAVSGYVESLANGQPVPCSDAIHQHLEVCPECLEEYEALESLYTDGQLED